MRDPVLQPVPDLLEAAGEWALMAEDGLSARDAARLEAWLAVDPRHAVAYDHVQDAGRVLERHGGDEIVMAMRRAALKARPERRSLSSAMVAGLAAALLAVSLLGGWGMAGFPDPTTLGFGGGEPRAARYVTAAGERATVSLPDGSVLTLNTDSAAEVAFDRRARVVRLVKGQALFAVAHDPSRPFRVQAGDRQVTAVGTVFDVLLLPENLRVALLDGVVRVSAEQSRPGPVQTLSAGEVMTARADGTVTVRKADTARLAGWRDGMVHFEETPLDEAVAEMNRYARRPIVVVDAKARALRVSGAFRTTEADTFAGTMVDIFPLSINHSADGRTILASAPT